jgi:hypothetical protein
MGAAVTELIPSSITVFVRELLPDMICTRDGGTLKTLENSSQHSLLAASSTGAALRVTFKPPLYAPQILLLDERGCALTTKTALPFFSRSSTT